MENSEPAQVLLNRGGNQVCPVDGRYRHGPSDRQVAVVEQGYPRLQPRAHGSDRKSGDGSGKTPSTLGTGSLTGESGDSAFSVYMGRHKTVFDQDIAVFGANGCTGLFFFGGGKTTCAHLTAGNEEREAFDAAQTARRDGTAHDVTIIAPKVMISAQVKIQISNVVGTYPRIKQIVYDDKKSSEEGYWVFRAVKGSTSVKAKWERAGPPTRSPTRSSRKRERSRSPLPHR